MAKDTAFKPKISLRQQNGLMQLEKPVVMAIINLTPDSFFAGSRTHLNHVLERANACLQAGASILDLGGYSTRPHAASVSEAEEMDRLVPAIELLRQNLPNCTISADTFRANVARQAIAAGANWINDVGGGTLDPNMFATVAQLQVPYVLMHMRGTPQTMHQFCNYKNVAHEVYYELMAKVNQLHLLGVNDVIIDPGFGFAKNLEQNHQLLAKLKLFKQAQLPLLVGISRKSMVYKPLGLDSSAVLSVSQALHWQALQAGAHILRVHDAAEAKQLIDLFMFHKQVVENI